MSAATKAAKMIKSTPMYIVVFIKEGNRVVMDLDSLMQPRSGMTVQANEVKTETTKEWSPVNRPRWSSSYFSSATRNP